MGELLLDDKELAAKMDPLVELLDFTSTDPIHSKRLLAITLGGFLLAQIDEEISPKEVDRIREVLLNFIMHPDLVIDYAVQLIQGGENLDMLLQDLLIDLMDVDENERYLLMDIFIQIALSDGLLHRNETQILLDISCFLGIDRTSLLKELAIQLGRGNFFENQVPTRVNEILGRSDPFYLGDIEKRIEEAQNPAIEHESIVQLSQDADPQVRLSLFFNESTPDEIRLQMLDSPTFNRVLNALEQEQEANQEDG